MNAPGGGPPRNTARAGLAAAAASVLFLLVLPVLEGRADIYRWEDDKGDVHFTDDFFSIPPASRDGARPVVREAPEPRPAPGAPDRPAARPEPSRVAPAPPGAVPAGNREREREALASEIEQMKTKIEAKEKLIRQVDEKRSLATNPLRNRFVDPVDWDLYNKYRSELPQDRERLQELESRLESLK